MIRTAIALAFMLIAAPALAKTQPARAGHAAAPSIPDRPWYPHGYRDMRIAAEETVRLFPPALWEGDDVYDVVDCGAGSSDVPANPDWRAGQRELLALDVARMRSELARLGYRPQVYDAALIAHERAALGQIRIARPIAAETADSQSDYDSIFWGREQLAKAMEARRKQLQPRKPQIISVGGCGDGEQEFSVKLSPPNGRLWLINAFAFKLCERKVADPWNHEACGWSEFASGESATASGRYMYEARWPDGTVRRGAKVLQGTEDGGAIVIRRD